MLRLLPHRPTDIMEKSEYLFVRLPYPSVVVRYSLFLAEYPDDHLRFFEVVSGHVWEQMMLNLIIQPAIPEVG